MILDYLWHEIEKKIKDRVTNFNSGSLNGEQWKH